MPDGTKVRIIQILCPQRHCIVATAYESPDGREIPEITDRLKRQAQKAIAAGAMNPWCGICQSRKWTYEDQPTIFKSMEEAMPHLQLESDKQATVREYMRASRG